MHSENLKLVDWGCLEQGADRSVWTLEGENIRRIEKILKLGAL